jgi:hypothetical protein
MCVKVVDKISLTIKKLLHSMKGITIDVNIYRNWGGGVLVHFRH